MTERQSPKRDSHYTAQLTRHTPQTQGPHTDKHRNSPHTSPKHAHNAPHNLLLTLKSPKTLDRINEITLKPVLDRSEKMKVEIDPKRNIKLTLTMAQNFR